MSWLGDRLRRIREQRGYTQDELAELLDVGQQQIHRWETNKSDPSTDAIAGLAQILGVTADYLLGLVEDPGQRLQEKEFALAPEERKVVQAIRNGNFAMLFQSLAKLVKSPTVGQQTGDKGLIE